MTTAPPETATPPWPSSAAPGCWTARPRTCAPPTAGCTPTSPVRPSATATCPPVTSTSAPSGGYVLAPPSQIDGKPYHLIRTLNADGALDWSAVTALLEPQRHIARPQPSTAPDRDLAHLARWVASQQQGNRNAGLFWAANRALEADSAADLSPLAVAARQAGLDDKEITRTLNSARKTGHVPPDHQAEPAS